MMEMLEDLLTDYYAHSPNERQVVIHTGPAGMDLLAKAFQAKGVELQKAFETNSYEETSENPKINLESPDFGCIFALETKF